MASTMRTPRLKPLSLDSGNRLNSTFHSKNLTKAIHNRNATMTVLDVPTSPTLDISTTRTDEKQEIAGQLKLFKRNLDKIRYSGSKGMTLYGTLKKELEYLDKIETKKLFWQKQNQNRVKTLEKEIENVIKSQDDENDNKEIYLHLLDRMRNTKVHLEIKYLDHDINLNKQDQTLRKEVKKSQQANESKSRSYYGYKDYKYEITREEKDRLKQINKIDASMRSAQEDSLRKEEYKKRREEMLERAAIEDRSRQDVLLRESVMLHRLWYNAMTMKFNKEMQKNSVYEDAYQQIKITTGLQEISQIVENFLTKEQTYKSLMVAVNQKEVECNKYRQKIDEMQKNVSEIAMHDGSELDSESKHQLNSLRNNFGEVQEKRIEILNKKIKIVTWLKKTLNRMKTLTNKEMDYGLNENSSIHDYIMAVKGQAHDIINQEKLKIAENIEEDKKKKISSIIEEIPKEKLLAVFEDGDFTSSDLIGIENSDH